MTSGELETVFRSSREQIAFIFGGEGTGETIAVRLPRVNLLRKTRDRYFAHLSRPTPRACLQHPLTKHPKRKRGTRCSTMSYFSRARRVYFSKRSKRGTTLVPARETKFILSRHGVVVVVVVGVNREIDDVQ